MPGRMEGKVAFVTGGSEGIGGATAMRLAEEGAKVIVAARRLEPLAKLAQEIRSTGGLIETLTLDVGDLGSLASTIQDIAKRYGRLDALVNNACFEKYAMIVDIAIENWRRTMQINLDAVFVATQAAMRIMKASGGGAIVNMSAIAAVLAPAGMSAYAASKAALEQFTRAAAVEGGPHNVRVNAVSPGVLETPAVLKFASPEQLARIARDTPMRRLGTARDGANASLFLLSDEANYITGACIAVDGGKACELGIPA
jgi:meso-butanediol dehydrogenase/(S,S)-butanediol dehydrogenase/diacetyl reductase